LPNATKSQRDILAKMHEGSEIMTMHKRSKSGEIKSRSFLIKSVGEDKGIKEVRNSTVEGLVRKGILGKRDITSTDSTEYWFK
jgi:hypothetical protein